MSDEMIKASVYVSAKHDEHDCAGHVWCGKGKRGGLEIYIGDGYDTTVGAKLTRKRAQALLAKLQEALAGR